MSWDRMQMVGAPREKRTLVEGQFVPSRTPYGSRSGVIVDTSSTLGLATASACIRLVSELIGTMPLKVYRGESPDVTPARDSWQWYRLKEAPNDEQSAYDFWQDAAASIESSGNAWIWKALSRRPVRDEGDIQLFLIEPSRVLLRRDDQGRKYYEVTRNNRRERVPASQILHIRGWTVTPGADLGVSPIEMHRETLGSAIAARDFVSAFYRNGVTAAWGFKVPGEPPQEAVDRLQLEFDQRHAGIANAHRPIILKNGAEEFTTGISMKDAQYIETQHFSAEEVCRICRVHPRMVGILLDTQKSVNEDFQQFMQADMAPRITRIEMALGRDPDLFPVGLDLFPRFHTDAILRPSLSVRYAAYKDGLQAGFLVPNEPREKEDLPPVKWGDTIQQTPVGGAPNTPPKPATPATTGA